MHSILISIQKPIVNLGGDVEQAYARLRKAIDAVSLTKAPAESFLELGAGCWLLRTEVAMPILNQAIAAASNENLEWKLLVVENPTEWTHSIPKKKSVTF